VALDSDGQRVAFVSNSTNLVTTPFNGLVSQVFVRDLSARATQLISVNTAGTAASNDMVYGPAFSGDGSVLAFVGLATDLTAIPDNNGDTDLFVISQATPPPLMADVAITKTVSASSVAVGEELTYTVVVSNTGPGLATAVSVFDTLPPDVDVVSTDPAAVDSSGRSLTFNIGDLAAQASRTIRIVVRPNPSALGTTIVNKATSTSTTADPNSGNNNDVQSPSSTVILRPEMTPPTVVGVARYGVHWQPTAIVLTFSEPLNPTNASDPANYRLTLAGSDRRFGTADDWLIPLRQVPTYDASTRTVTLIPRYRLNLHRQAQLTVNGSLPMGISDPSGNLLDGDRDGRPGGNFVTTIDRSLLAGPFDNRPTGAAVRRLVRAVPRVTARFVR
jgi:uncharacterized repeat protein (TIGR01451 family)